MLETELAELCQEAAAVPPEAWGSLSDRAAWLQLRDALDRAAALMRRPAWDLGQDLVGEDATEADAAAGELWRALGVQWSAPVELVLRCRRWAQAWQQVLDRRTRRHRASSGVVNSGDEAALVATAASVVRAGSVGMARFGASAPAQAPLHRPFVVRWVVYPDGASAEAARLLDADSPDARAVLDVGARALGLGARLEVVAGGRGLRVDGGTVSSQEVWWTGTATLLTFEVEAVDLEPGDETVLRLEVRLDGITFTRIHLAITMRPQAREAPVQRADAARWMRAFASYASVDRLRVLDRVASIRLIAAVDVFLDCHDLNPGEAWEPRLAREIDHCDTFLLFWSDAAAQSHWVRWEWERALRRHGAAHLQFHPLENGVKPPQELADRHAADPYADLYAAERSRRDGPSVARRLS